MCIVIAFPIAFQLFFLQVGIKPRFFFPKNNTSLQLPSIFSYIIKIYIFFLIKNMKENIKYVIDDIFFPFTLIESRKEQIKYKREIIFCE